MMEQAIRMKQATPFKLSHRIIIDHNVDTSIVNTTVMLMDVPLPCGTDAACLNWYLVMLHAQTLPCMELITTVHGTSAITSD